MKNKNSLNNTKHSTQPNKQEVRKRQKTSVRKYIINWLVINKWRVVFGLCRVLMKWDIYSQKATWVFEVLKTMF